jgi:hypothetical protein
MSWGNRIRTFRVKENSHGEEEEGEDDVKKWKECCEILRNLSKGPLKYNGCTEDTKI